MSNANGREIIHYFRPKAARCPSVSSVVQQYLPCNPPPPLYTPFHMFDASFYRKSPDGNIVNRLTVHVFCLTLLLALCSPLLAENSHFHVYPRSSRARAGSSAVPSAPNNTASSNGPPKIELSSSMNSTTWRLTQARISTLPDVK